MDWTTEEEKTEIQEESEVFVLNPILMGFAWCRGVPFSGKGVGKGKLGPVGQGREWEKGNSGRGAREGGLQNGRNIHIRPYTRKLPSNGPKAALMLFRSAS